MKNLEQRVEKSVKILENFIQKKEEFRRTHPLRYLFWESTLRCNLSCRHCGSDCVCDNSTQADELPNARIKQELREIAQHYSPRKITFAIIGGEPLMRLEDILEVGAYARRLGYHWGITTNGMLLTPKVVSRLKAAGLETIAVSLDGLQPQHDALRNRPGSYLIVATGIKALLAERFWRKLDVICCVSQINLFHLDDFLISLTDLGVPAVRLVPIFSRGRAARNIELSLKNADYRYLLDFIAAKREEYSGILEVSMSEEGYWGPEYEGRIRKNFHYCASGILIGTILHNGEVIGCPSMSRELVQGNIKSDSFVKIWKERFQRYRRGKKELFADTCGDCEHWMLCEGGGMHLLNLEGAIPDHCRMRKIYG